VSAADSESTGESWKSCGPERTCYSLRVAQHVSLLVRERLAVAEALDDLWSESMGLSSGDRKAKPLRMVAELLARELVSYALIGGVAVQIHTADPRTTLAIDLAIASYDEVPTDALRSAGFEHTGRFEHSDNWRAPGPGPLKARTAVQFSAEDEGIAAAIANAGILELEDGVELRVASVGDLIVLKLLAAEEPTRRPSKRQHDIGDVLALFEEHPDAATEELRRRLQTVQRAIVETPTRRLGEK
jgi:hypothetical protein